MAEPKDYSDKALKEIKEDRLDDANLTLRQAFNDLNPHKFKDVIDKMTKANPNVQVETKETYNGVKEFPKTVTLKLGDVFGTEKTLFRRK